MNREHENDISIGKDQWIIFDDLESDRESAVNIDPLMVGLQSMWCALETECESACCGIDAYGLWEEDIKKNTSEFSQAEIVNKLESLKAELSSFEGEVLVSNKLNNYFTKNTFLQIVDHLINVYRNTSQTSVYET